MKYTVFVLANCPSDNGDPVEVTQHTFDSESQEDLELVTPDEGDEFETACDRYVYETVMMEYQQQFISCILLSEEQATFLNLKPI